MGWGWRWDGVMGQQAITGPTLTPPGQDLRTGLAAITGTRQLPGNQEGVGSEELRAHLPSPDLQPGRRLTGSLGTPVLPGQSRWALEAAAGPGCCCERGTSEVSASPAMAPHPPWPPRSPLALWEPLGLCALLPLHGLGGLGGPKGRNRGSRVSGCTVGSRGSGAHARGEQGSSAQP